jgi:predicted Fe-S protein YdhL (DUF1289 family)
VEYQKVEEAMANGVQSPCVRNCCLNDSDICVGCFRSLVEITRWSLINDDAKMQILAQVAIRKAQQYAPHNDLGDSNKVAGT